MNYYQSPYLARLQDLKVWQVNYDSIIQNKSRDSNHPSDYETIEGLSTLDTSNGSIDPTTDNTDWDKKAISPTKPFAQLLEEKLAEDEPVQVQPKPKKPFLRKGAGLLRYKLGPKSVRAKKPERKSNEIRRISPNHKNELKSTVDANTEPEVCMIPLKMPDVNIKPKATWSKFVHNSDTCSGTKHEIFEEKKSPPIVSRKKIDFQQSLINQANEDSEHLSKIENK